MAGGGYGEAALMGAAFGAGRSLLSGKGDPLEGGIKGAMLGTAGGALMNGLGGAAPGAGFDYANALGSAEGVAAMPEYGYTWNQASGMLEPAATAESFANATSGAYGAPVDQWAASRWTSPEAAGPLSGIDLGGPGSSPATGWAGTTAGQGAGQNAGIGSLSSGPVSPDRANPQFMKDPLEWMSQNKMKTAAGALGLYTLANWNNLKNPNYLKPYQPPTAEQYGLGARLSPNYKPTVPMQAGGVVEQMSNANAIGQNTGYPQSGITQGAYSTPWQTPVSRNVLEGASDTAVDPITGQMKFSDGGGISGLMNYAKGGNVSTLGSYSDGGSLLKGPGDGMSDSIPASIDNKQPARLGDGEFVVPADVVSHLGNGSTDAGAKQLYKMMDKVRQARTGRKSQGKQINPRKYMPA